MVEVDGTGLTPREDLFARIKDRFGLAEDVPWVCMKAREGADDEDMAL